MSLSIRRTDTLGRFNGVKNMLIRGRSYTRRSIPPNARDAGLNEKRTSGQPSFIRKCPRIEPSADSIEEGAPRAPISTGKYWQYLTMVGVRDTLDL